MITTIKDVAQRAAVSKTTVSLVLNGKAGSVGIATATVDRVLEAAEELGYVPNQLVKSLRRNRMAMIGFLHGSFELPKPSIIAGCLCDAFAPEYGFAATCHRFKGEIERRRLQQFLESRCAGVVALWTGDPASIPCYRELTERYNVPLVLFDRSIDGLDVPSVLGDYPAMTMKAVDSLYELGHRRIAFAASGGKMAADVGNLDGYLRGMRARGCEAHAQVLCPKHDVLPCQQPVSAEVHTRYSREILDWWQEDRDRATAIVMQSDLLAFQFLNECRSRGVRVPEDLSVVALATYSSSICDAVGLSTVGTADIELMGQVIANLMLRLVEGKPVEPTAHFMPTGVCMRHSTRRC